MEIAEPVNTSSLEAATQSCIESAGLTEEERGVIDTLFAQPGHTVTRYRLVQAIPHLTMYTHSGFFSILDRATTKLSPNAEALCLPDDFRIYTVGAVGLMVMSEAEYRATARKDIWSLYGERFLKDTRDEVLADIQSGSVDLNKWETTSCNGYGFHFLGIGVRRDDGQMNKFVSVITGNGQEQPAVGVLTSNNQYRTLQIMLSNQGYIDPVLSERFGGPSNLQKTVEALNASFSPMLGRDLIASIPKISRGYAIDAAIEAKTERIGEWLNLSREFIHYALTELPCHRIYTRKAEPYAPQQKKGINSMESRFFRAIDSSFIVVHTNTLIRGARIAEGFDRHAGKPFLFIYQRDTYSRNGVGEELFAIELTEAEALTLLLFQDNEEIELAPLGLDYRERGRARERFKSFMKRLEKMGFQLEGWQATRSRLLFPAAITAPKR